MPDLRQEIAEPRTQALPKSADGPGRSIWSRWLLTCVIVLSLAGVVALGSVSPRVLFGLALAGLVPLAGRLLYRWRARRRWKVAVLACVPVALVLAVGVRTYFRYSTADVMQVPIREYAHEEYAEDPAGRSIHHGQYQGRRLVLVQKDATHFDFVFEPDHPHVAKVVFRDVDVSLMTPGLPAWARDDRGLERIALTDRQWNRQQVRFDPNGPHVEVTGGDGFERVHLYSAELAKNCLNAGLWELLLFEKEGDGKAMYYQGWFTFPLGKYRQLFERNTGLAYHNHWYYLEHWFDPAGTAVPMDKLRRVTAEREPATTFELSERVIVGGEQVRKVRTTLAENVVSWGNFYDGRRVQFASFIPPGRYSVSHPRNTEYGRMDHFEKAVLRKIVSSASEKPLDELELIFRGSRPEGVCRLFVSGVDLQGLPQLPIADYPRGFYMPMGIGVPPFFQSYEELKQNPPDRSPYVSVLLDADGGWIDHHSVGIDGPVMHRDERDPNLLHVYLLSYERHTLVGHFAIRIGED